MTLLLTLFAIATPQFDLATPAAELPRAGVGAKIKHRPTARERRIARWRKHRRNYIRNYRAWLARTRRCESGGRYGIATGNGFFGAYQFLPSTWRAVGGRGMPHTASRLEQDYRAVVLLRRSGAGNWPVCGR